MMTPQQRQNQNIGCNVSQCRYNCRAEQCCSLDQIEVLQEERDGKSEHATCCHSFECK